MPFPSSTNSYQHRNGVTTTLQPSMTSQLYGVQSVSSPTPTYYGRRQLEPVSTRWWQTSSKLPADSEDDVIYNGSSQRLHTLYDQLIRSSVTGSEGRTKSSGIREELDSFARTLDGIPLSKFRGQANTDSPLITSHLVKEQEIADKLARSRNELEQLERLVDKTFGRLGTDKNPVHTIDKVSVVGDSLYSTVDSNQPYGWLESNSLAAVAVRWAEERRRRVEREIAGAANDGDYRQFDHVPRLHRNDRISSHQSLIDIGDSMTSDILRPRCRRSISASTEPARKQVRESSSERGFAMTAKSKPKPEMSEARRKVRALLCKSKGDPHYFDRVDDD